MPTSNDMRKVLDIQDKHIIFNENCVTFGERRKKKAKFIHCTLTYTPKECHKCGAENTNFTVFKNGTQTSCITFPIKNIKITRAADPIKINWNCRPFKIFKSFHIFTVLKLFFKCYNRAVYMVSYLVFISKERKK